MNWKKLGKIAGITIGGLFVVVTVVGFALPRKMRVARTVEIDAKSTDIYPLIASFKDGWPQWSPFQQPDAKMSYSGPTEGVGATQTWDGDSTGDGKLVITKADPQRGIEMDLTMMQESFKATGSLLCEPSGQGTKVTWADEFDYGSNPYRRYYALVVEKPLGEMFDKGLQDLKKKSEERRGQAVTTKQ